MNKREIEEHPPTHLLTNSPGLGHLLRKWETWVLDLTEPYARWFMHLPAKLLTAANLHQKAVSPQNMEAPLLI